MVRPALVDMKKSAFSMAEHLKSFGVKLSSKQCLEVLARMQGFKTYEAMLAQDASNSGAFDPLRPEDCKRAILDTDWLLELDEMHATIFPFVDRDSGFLCEERDVASVLRGQLDLDALEFESPWIFFVQVLGSSPIVFLGDEYMNMGGWPVPSRGSADALSVVASVPTELWRASTPADMQALRAYFSDHVEDWARQLTRQINEKIVRVARGVQLAESLVKQHVSDADSTNPAGEKIYAMVAVTFDPDALAPSPAWGLVVGAVGGNLVMAMPPVSVAAGVAGCTSSWIVPLYVIGIDDLLGRAFVRQDDPEVIDLLGEWIVQEREEGEPSRVRIDAVYATEGCALAFGDSSGDVFPFIDGDPSQGSSIGIVDVVDLLGQRKRAAR